MRGLVRWSLRGLLVVVVVVVGLWGWWEGQQWLLRVRAERLLSEVRSLELGQDATSVVQDLRTRYRAKSEFYESCTDGTCGYSVWLVDPGAALLRGAREDDGLSKPLAGAVNLLIGALNHIGIRASGVKAYVAVRGGVIVGYGFGEVIEVPPGHWWDRGAFWPGLMVFAGASTHLRSEPWPHANRSFRENGGGLQATFTPQESAEERKALMDFRFECMTRWRPCLTNADVLPRVFEEYSAEEKPYLAPGAPGQLEAAARWGRPHCPIPVEALAREASNVVVGDVMEARLLRATDDDIAMAVTSWSLRARIDKVLKGQLPHSAEMKDFQVRLPNTGPSSQSVSAKFPFGHALFLGGTEGLEDKREFVAADCGVVDATAENVAAAMKGVADDFDPDGY